MIPDRDYSDVIIFLNNFVICVELIRRPKLEEILVVLTVIQVTLSLFRDFARNKCCSVIMTIHQPSSPTFKLFDDLMLLSKGSSGLSWSRSQGN